MNLSNRYRDNLIWDFERGKNIKYNLAILDSLYSSYLYKGSILVKPIVIWNLSIIEVLLYDFITGRIKNASNEIIPNLDEMIQREISSKKISKLDILIKQAKKHDLFKLEENSCKKLITLGKIRNRIHIQNDKNHNPILEKEVFNEKIRILSEQALEKIISILEEEYPRVDIKFVDLNDHYFYLPWEKHYK